MSKYTMELRNVCEIYGKEEVENWFKDYNLTDYLTSAQIESIENQGLWNKDKLATKIVEHYFMREIGFETPMLFKLQAKIKMQEIMEDYLPVIYSNSLNYDPLVNVDFTETFERDITGTAKNTGKSSSNSRNNASGLNVNSDTPQGQISKQNILNGNYASQTGASETESTIQDETNTENNGNSNTAEKYTRHQKGNSGTLTTAQALIKQYRDIIRAVDREIIENLNILFMGIY